MRRTRSGARTLVYSKTGRPLAISNSLKRRRILYPSSIVAPGARSPHRGWGSLAGAGAGASAGDGGGDAAGGREQLPDEALARYAAGLQSWVRGEEAGWAEGGLLDVTA